MASLAWSQVTPARPIVLVVPFAAGRPTDLVARAAPDDTTLLIHHKGMATAPALYRQLPYDPLTDFEFVGQVVDVTMTLIGRKGLPAKSLPELLIYLKSRGDKVKLAHAGRRPSPRSTKIVRCRAIKVISDRDTASDRRRQRRGLSDRVSDIGEVRRLLRHRHRIKQAEKTQLGRKKP